MVELYRWPDGWTIQRVTTERAAMVRMGSWAWDLIKSGTMVLFLLLDEKKETKYRFELMKGLTAGRVGLVARWEDLDSEWRDPGDVDVAGKVLAFLEDMVMGSEQDHHDGRIYDGVLPVPVFLDDQIWHRMKDLDLDYVAKIPHRRVLRSGPHIVYAVWCLLMDVFEGTEVQVLENNSDPRSAAFEIVFRSDEPNAHSLSLTLVLDLEGNWRIFDGFNDVLVRAPTLLEAWNGVRVSTSNSRFLWESAEENWFEKHLIEGKRRFDVDAYLNLGEPSPVGWPHDDFMEWYQDLTTP